MSAENVELVRRALATINAVGDTDPGSLDPEEVAPEVWARLDPDLELHERSDLPDAKVYRGREESKEFWRKTSELFSDVRWEPRELIDLEHAVVVNAKVVVTGRGSEVPIEADDIGVCWFRAGSIVRLQAFSSLEEAMAAAQSISYEGAG
jgi:ketosteroid isomerase-like protein